MAVLGSTSLTGCNSIPAFIAAGTVAIFRQSSAPSSWTKDTSNHNNKCLRCVTGTASSGGNVAFTTAFASKPVSGNVSTNVSTNVSVTVGGHTLSEAQLPSHDHSQGSSSVQQAQVQQINGPRSNTPYRAGGNTGNAGSNQSHSHPSPATGTSNATSSFSGTAIDMEVQYVDVIQCSKD